MGSFTADSIKADLFKNLCRIFADCRTCGGFWWEDATNKYAAAYLFVAASGVFWARVTESKELAVGAGKREDLKFFPRKPPAPPDIRQTAVDGGPVSFQRDSVARDGVPDHTQRLEIGWCGLEHEFCNLIQGQRIRGQLRVWELPKMGVHHASRSLAHQKTAAILGDKGGESSGGGTDGTVQMGDCFHAAGSAGHTLSGDWAELAFWLRRAA